MVFGSKMLQSVLIPTNWAYWGAEIIIAYFIRVMFIYDQNV